MLTAADVKNITFSKAMGGFKPEEVDVFLDKVEADYVRFEQIIKEYQATIENLNKEIEGYKFSQNSIQNVLVSAQKLADQIINEAKEKSEEIVSNAQSSISAITAHEKELSATFELKAQERRSALEKELNTMIKDAQAKADAVTKAAEDSVARQQALFDRLKLEISGFKSGITAKYKEHLELLKTIPDSVPTDPETIAKAVAAACDKQPSPEDFIKDNNDLVSNTSPKGFKVENDEDLSVQEEIDY